VGRARRLCDARVAPSPPLNAQGLRALRFAARQARGRPGTMTPSGPSAPAFSAFFHVRREALAELGTLRFGVRGDVIFASVADAQRLVEVLGARRANAPVTAVTVVALAVLHELAHQALATLRERGVFDAEVALDRALEGRRAQSDEALRAFAGAFPPPPVHAGEHTIDSWFAHAIEGRSGRGWLAEELLLHGLASRNPAYEPIRPVIADDDLAAVPAYVEAKRAVERGLRAVRAASVGIDLGEAAPDGSMLDVLLAPTAAGDDVHAQLARAFELWGPLLAGRALQIRWHDFGFGALSALEGEADLTPERLLLAVQSAANDEHAYFERVHGGFAGGKGAEIEPAPFYEGAPGVGDDPLESRSRASLDDPFEAPEQFSEDEDWMPRLVLLAKSTYVWLHQLSRRYGREIRTLDAIPDEELERIAARGFTGLWLIGLWKRSKASKRIKELTGMRDVIASAYSLDDYVIAPELGGPEAMDALRAKAKRAGLRLAADMVPNHMGIDSAWLRDNPEWFLASKEPPFPNYRFTGENLSDDARFAVQLEDGYWDRSDAAVVFQRTDAKTGEPLYVYHGNDGTSVPWNDTAQLDFAKAEVREHVIRVIIGIAKQFPVIRFDAAMVLAKRHIQRLWYPEPGKGGAIPSRSAYAVSRAAFDRLVPEEFWREVVDRVAVEAPDTLLLAEAFWLMESYFVRTLGMHRVYNSAFLNMLERERNREFRFMIKQAIEFNPKILERYVNFMNNPDEATAAEAFGTGDKYFGAATLLATMPGLPLFGHGQFEGNREKYGMEFAKPRLQEEDDPWVVARHERWIVPLLQRRDLYAEARHFRLFDLRLPELEGGEVDDDVIAYGNRQGRERALVLFHNRAAHTRGFLDSCSPFRVAEEGLVSERLAEFLGLSRRPGRFLVFRDVESGLRYVRPVELLWSEGFRVELGPYESRVLTGFEEVEESLAAPYGKLYRAIGDRGVPSLEDALSGLVSSDEASRSALVLETLFRWPLTRGFAHGGAPRLEAPATRAMETAFLRWVDAESSDRDARASAARWAVSVAWLKGLVAEALAQRETVTPLQHLLVRSFGGSVDGWVVLACIAAERQAREVPLVRASVEGGWRRAFEKLGVLPGEAALLAKLVAVCGELLASATFEEGVRALYTDPSLRELLGVHEAVGGTWMRAEAVDSLLVWLEEAARALAFAREQVLPLASTAASMPPPAPVPEAIAVVVVPPQPEVVVVVEGEGERVIAPEGEESVVLSTEATPAEGDTAEASTERADVAATSTAAVDAAPAAVETAPLAPPAPLPPWPPVLPELVLDAARVREAALASSYRFDVFSPSPAPESTDEP
jgi:glycosidase